LHLRRFFLAGLLVIVPAALTFWVIWLLFRKVDGILGGVLAYYTGYSIPGLGFVAVILLVLFVGMLASNLVGRRLVGIGDHIIARVPIVSRIYTAVKQISEVFLTDKGTVFRRAVLIEYPRRGIYSVAFVTAEHAACLGDPGSPSPTIHVFLPTTPNPTSGFFLAVPVEDVIPLNMDIENALKLVISAGSVVPTSNGKSLIVEDPAESTSGETGPAAESSDDSSPETTPPSAASARGGTGEDGVKKKRGRGRKKKPKDKSHG
jgi:uncharacterized membrane protein